MYIRVRFFNKATHYEEGIWDTPEAKTCFDIVNKLMDTEGVHNATLIACQSEAGN